MQERLTNQEQIFGAQLLNARDELESLRRHPFGKLLALCGWPSKSALSFGPASLARVDLANVRGLEPSGTSSDALPPPSAVGSTAMNEICPEESTVLEKLLVLNDVEFVRAAYKTILKRAPDTEGEQNYIQLLQSGVDKVILLRDMSRSDEGQRARVNLPGLSRAVRERRVRRVPFLGPLVVGTLRLFRRGPDNDPELAFRNQQIGTQRLISERLANVEASIDGLRQQQVRFEQIVRRLESQTDAINPHVDDANAGPVEISATQYPGSVERQLSRKAAACKA
jgi:hypothetical protein